MKSARSRVRQIRPRIIYAISYRREKRSSNVSLDIRLSSWILHESFDCSNSLVKHRWFSLDSSRMECDELIKKWRVPIFIAPYRARWWSNPLNHLRSTFPIWFKGLLTCKLTRASHSMTPKCHFEALMSFSIVEQFLQIVHAQVVAALMSIRYLWKFWWGTWQF